MAINRLVATLGACSALAGALLTAGPASADPPKKPYPDISRYSKMDFEGFQITDKPGVWFSSPTGLDCGIWDDGSFGCTGPIPGSPAGTNQIGWFRGDGAAHFDNTAQPRFSSGQAQRVLPANNYIEYKGAKCATTPDNGVYCTTGYTYSESQFLVNPTGSWLGRQES